MVRHTMLGSRVMAVARSRIDGTWTANCDCVIGADLEVGIKLVLDHGTKLPEEVARALFPFFDGVPYAPQRGLR